MGILRVEKVCAWCKKDIETIYQPGPETGTGRLVTHGICKRCKDKLLGEYFSNRAKIREVENE